MANELRTKILLLNGTVGIWNQLASYKLDKGEPAVEFTPDENDASKLKSIKLRVGDGSTTYENLPVVANSSTIEQVASLNTSVGYLVSEVEKLTALETDVDTLKTDVEGLKSTVSTLGNAVFEADDETDGADDLAKIATVVGDADLKEGNIAIVKHLINAADADKEIDAHYSYTAYVYNGEDWAAMDGNYDASNVYFDNDLTFTTNVGYLKLASGKTKGTFSAKGKSLEDVIKDIISQTTPPTITQPKYTLDSVTADVGSSVEIGTKVTKLYWKATFTDGTYSYKSTEAPTSTAAGCTATYSMSCDVEGTTSDAAKEDGTWTLTTPFQVTKTTEETVGTISTTCKISDSPRTPLNNIGDEVDGKITNVSDKTGSKSFKVTGYRAWFCGYKNGDNAIKNESGAADATLITGDQIRTLGNSANGSWLSSMNVSQMQQMFFAAPAGKGYKPSVADSKTTAPQTVQGPFTVYVKGANNYVAEGDETTNGGVAYDVWYVNNTSAASGSAGLTIGRA